MQKLTIDDVDLKGRRVLMRVDFNVPLTEGGVADDTRIQATLPTILKVIGDGGRAVLVSHLGRPKGQVKREFSLAPVAAHLSALVGRPVPFAEDCVGPTAAAVVKALGDGDLCLLENLRFHSGEEKNDPAFAAELAAWGDIYVNDAFGTAHRAHASTVGVTEIIPVCVAGYLMKRELEYLGRLLADPPRPFVALLGGSKVSGKLEVISCLSGIVDAILIGGGMAFTFLKAQGKEVGRSLVEDNLVDTAREILRQTEQSGRRLVLPSDCVVAPDLESTSKLMTVGVDGIPYNHAGYDIGPESVREFAAELGRAATIFWNGPMGVFETPPFDSATAALAQAIAAATDRGAISVVGGGDSVAAVHAAGVAERISHISTGGGASLEFMEGKTLPGVAALSDRKVPESVGR